MNATCPAKNCAIPLLNLFAERYIFCDNEQATLDAEFSRDNITEAFTAIIDAIRCCLSGCNGNCKTCEKECHRS